MGSVFLLGVPARVLLLLVGPRLLPEFRNPNAGRLDLASVALSLGAILPIVYGLKELARGGWQPLPVATIVVGLVVGWRFVRRQHALADTGANPLLDLRLFANRAFSTTLGSLLANSTLAGGTMVFIAQHFQLVEGLSPLRAGLALVPGLLAAIGSFQLAPVLARRIRPALLFSGGLVVSVAGPAAAYPVRRYLRPPDPDGRVHLGELRRRPAGGARYQPGGRVRPTGTRRIGGGRGPNRQRVRLRARHRHPGQHRRRRLPRPDGRCHRRLGPLCRRRGRPRHPRWRHRRSPLAARSARCGPASRRPRRLHRRAAHRRRRQRRAVGRDRPRDRDHAAALAPIGQADQVNPDQREEVPASSLA